MYPNIEMRMLALKYPNIEMRILAVESISLFGESVSSVREYRITERASASRPPDLADTSPAPTEVHIVE